MSEIVSILTGGGAGTALGTVVGGLLWWRTTSTRFGAEIASQVAQDLRRDNRGLAGQKRRLERALYAAREHAAILSVHLRLAIPYVQAAGVDTTEMRAALTPPPDSGSDPA